MDRVLSLLLPRRCAVCEAAGIALCQACERGLVRLLPPLCERCGSPGAWPVERCAECSGRRLAFARARSAVIYDAAAKRLVGAWKERGRRDLADVAARIVAATIGRPEVDVVAFVPAHPERSLERGHAPARALARELGRLWELPVEPLLSRGGRLRHQSGLGRAERRRNVAGVFAAARASPARVCLVDDVYTSGATAAACATELGRAGARRVEVVSFARAVR